VAWLVDSPVRLMRDHHLDRTHLPPSPTPGRTRAVDPSRIRSNHDHTG